MSLETKKWKKFDADSLILARVAKKDLKPHWVALVFSVNWWGSGLSAISLIK
jgi:hypothetical protein